MRSSTRLWAILGLIPTAISLVIWVLLILIQIDPAATSAESASVLTLLLFIGAIMFDSTYLDWKQKPPDVAVLSVSLVLIGFVGFAAVHQFHNALIDVFFPKTRVLGLLYSGLSAVIMAGVLLPVLARAFRRSSSATAVS